MLAALLQSIHRQAGRLLCVHCRADIDFNPKSAFLHVLMSITSNLTRTKPQ
jgi:hypothetical protein